MYYDKTSGHYYSIDTQHGTFEKCDIKTGKHLGEYDFSLQQTKPADTSGGHNLKVK